MPRLLHLWQQMGGAFDGAGNEQREKAHENGIVDKAMGRFYLIAVNIKNVGKAVKGIKGDADGQDDVERPGVAMVTHVMKQGGKVFNEEIIVFKKAQEAEIDCYAEQQPGSFGAYCGRVPDFKPGKIIQRRGEKQQEQEAVIPAAVKKITGGQQQQVLCFKPVAGDQPVQTENNGQEGSETEGIK